MNRENTFSLSSRILVSIFYLFSAGYLITLEYHPYPFSFIIKIVPVLSLLVFAFINLIRPGKNFIVAALLMSAAGDYFLTLSGSQFFIYGLASFATAHCLYITAFLDKPELKRGKSFFIYFFLFYGISVISIFAPRLGDMMIPVVIYIILITMMGISAAAGKNNHTLVVAGAFLFMLSDSLIAVNMFLTSLPNSGFWIMATYFPAQFLITWGMYKKYGREKIAGV